MVYKSFRKVLIAFGLVLYGLWISHTHKEILNNSRYVCAVCTGYKGRPFLSTHTAAYKHQGQQGLQRQGIQEEARTAALKQAVDT